MENQNENLTNSQGGDLSELKGMFDNYHKQEEQSTRKSPKDLLKRYFIPRNSTETFRILPPKAGKKRIEEAFFHVVTTNIAGGKKKHGTVIYCPAHNDPKVPKLDSTGKPVLDTNGNPIMVQAPCPLCDRAKKILATQDQSLKGKKKDDLTANEKIIFESNRKIFMDAGAWEAKKFYIVKGIDRGTLADGVKFWRFKHNYKNQGTLNKLLPVFELFMNTYSADYSSPVNGADLNIVMTNTEWNGRVYKTISAIMSKPPSPLSTDELVSRQWLQDDTTWRDVFLAKKAPNTPPYEYLKLVAEGNCPYWDDLDATNKHWVFPNHPDLQEKANTRTQNLDATSNDSYEYATDLADDEYPKVTIDNMDVSKVGDYNDDATNVGAEVIAEKKAPKVEPKASEPETFSIDDLPF